MSEILAKFFKFSGKENGNKFKLSIAIGIVDSLATAMKIPAVMYILMGMMSGDAMGKYIKGSLAIMLASVIISGFCKKKQPFFKQRRIQCRSFCKNKYCRAFEISSDGIF